ncbi:MAG: hypothetical protein LBN39_01920 [Planctomycetaceae bacterium]|jgi:hypothetical protein|nr:hypothetical protein [Planctomycetaceae bacterium]
MTEFEEQLAAMVPKRAADLRNCIVVNELSGTEPSAPSVPEPTTTGIAEPLTFDGKPDYFGALEQTYLRKLSPPRDNGLRLIIAVMGPSVLEHQYLADKVPWAEYPTHKESKQWYAEYWVPLCSAMGIDPFAEPKYLKSKDWYGYIGRKRKEKKEEVKNDGQEEQGELNKLHDQLAAVPWKHEEQPDTAAWIQERSPVLDLFGIAVRKPNYVCWRQNNHSLLWVLLPDVQAQRALARDAQIRITERLGRGDVDGAWYDAMSMFYLNAHLSREPFFVSKLVGIASANMGWKSVQTILRYGKISKEQLRNGQRNWKQYLVAGTLRCKQHTSKKSFSMKCYGNSKMLRRGSGGK